jgi:hypothetical protein
VCVSSPSGRQVGRDPRRPLHPGVALLPRQGEHLRRRPRPVDQLALEPLQPQPPLLRLEDLVGGARLQEARAAGGDRLGAMWITALTSVSRTLASAAAGTGRRFGPAFAAGRCCAASVLPAHCRFTLAMSKPPSASRLIRPAASAFRTAVSLTPSASASLRLLVARMAIDVPSQRLNLAR